MLRSSRFRTWPWNQEMISPGMNQKEGGIWFFLSSPWRKYIRMCKIHILLKERIHWLWPSTCKQSVLFLLSIKPRVGCKRESEGSADLEAETHQVLKLDDEQQEMVQKEIAGLVQRKIELYPRQRTAMRGCGGNACKRLSKGESPTGRHIPWTNADACQRTWKAPCCRRYRRSA